MVTLEAGPNLRFLTTFLLLYIFLFGLVDGFNFNSRSLTWDEETFATLAKCSLDRRIPVVKVIEDNF